MSNIPVKHRLFNLLLCTLAIGGLAASVFAGFSIKTSANTFSDLKTLYASAWCFLHGVNAYSFSGIQAEFLRQGVVSPANWYGHAPVYPPTTLALISPFCLFPMATAVCILTAISVAVFIAALASLLRYFSNRFEMTWVGKAIVVTACASGPLLGFALSVGNLSVLATSLAILAFTAKPTSSRWIPASSLAVAILLKPHLAIWYAVGMFLLQENQRRAIALRAAGIVAVSSSMLGVALAVKSSLMMQVHGLLSTLAFEASAGSSMNVSSRETLPIEAQITSLQSIVGFWNVDHAVSLVVAAVVLGLAAWWLVRATLGARTEEEAMLAVGAWVAFGLLATYHRAHDASALLLLVPFLLNRLRRSPADWKGWAIIGLYLLMSIGPSQETIAGISGGHSLLTFLVLRQAGIADACLMLTLFLTLREYRIHREGCRLDIQPLAKARIALHANFIHQERSKQQNLEPVSQRIAIHRDSVDSRRRA